MTEGNGAETLLPGAPEAGRRRLAWLNFKLVIGTSMVLVVVLFGLLGPLFWNAKLADPASSPPNLPPIWEAGGTGAHPFGTESLGRDILALLIVGSEATLRVGAIAAAVGLVIAVVLGFGGGYLGGWVDDVVRVLADSWVTIPALAVLVVLAAALQGVTADTEALLLALFSWPEATRMIRSQMLSMRGRSYVKMARLSGVSSVGIMFTEILPNMIPYVVASFVRAMAGAIMAATGLEALGLGPTQTPTLGTTIYYSIQGSALLRGIWWWWGLPVVVLVLIFSGLFILSIGLDEVANPRLKRYRYRTRLRLRRPAVPVTAASVLLPEQATIATPSVGTDQ
jgi:peptide/nickel transport system permease protein